MVTPASDSPEQMGCQNTDREIWRKVPGDFYSPRIYVTQGSIDRDGNIDYGIGIDCHGSIFIASIEKWHSAGDKLFLNDKKKNSWRYRFALWLLSTLKEKHSCLER